MARHVQDRAHDVLAQLLEAARRRGEDALPRTPILAEPAGGVGERPHDHSRAAVVERVGQVDLGPAPLEAVTLQRELVQRRCADRHHVHGRAVVVQQTRERQLAAASAAADARLGLQHGHLQARTCEHGRARQSIRAGTDDERIAHYATGAPAGRRALEPITSTGNVPVSSSHGWRSTMSLTWT